MAKHNIAVIAGDGVGKEVMPEGVRALDAAANECRMLATRLEDCTNPADFCGALGAHL